MNSFELSFGLTSVILGLALAHMANAARKLMLRGREVAWAPESILLVMINTFIIVSVWMNQFAHNKTASTDGLALLNLLRMLALYFAAGFSLPEPEPGEGKIDLRAYYYRTRRFSAASLVASLTTFWVYNSLTAPANWRSDLTQRAIPILCWIVVILVRWRWVNLLVLVLATVGTALDLNLGAVVHLGPAIISR